MITERALVELDGYRKLEGRLNLKFCPYFRHLVVSDENDLLPVHRWFRFKESYSANLLPTLLSSYDVPNRQGPLFLLDPYCGVGTSLLAAQLLQSPKLTGLGIEHNPFIKFVAEAKLSWSRVDPRRLIGMGESLADVPPADYAALPALSSFTTGKCMSEYVARRLLAVRNAIMANCKGAYRRLLLLGLAASIEPLSRTRKDGRALRIVDKPRQVVSAVLRSKWMQMADDVSRVHRNQPVINSVRVVSGDGRIPSCSGIAPNSVDIIVTSPPYPNNIDYSEVYKLELWLLGFVQDATSFLRLRKGTFRSHPTSDLSCSDSQLSTLLDDRETREAMRPLLDKLDTERERWRRKLVVGYFADISVALKAYFRALRPGGKAFVTVGNSLHGGEYTPYVIATDLFVAVIARASGFRVDELVIARSLPRRLAGNHFLRETMLVLSK